MKKFKRTEEHPLFSSFLRFGRYKEATQTALRADELSKAMTQKQKHNSVWYWFKGEQRDTSVYEGANPAKEIAKTLAAYAVGTATLGPGGELLAADAYSLSSANSISMFDALKQRAVAIQQYDQEIASIERDLAYGNHSEKEQKEIQKELKNDEKKGLNMLIT